MGRTRHVLLHPEPGRLLLACALACLAVSLLAPTASADDKSGVTPNTISLPSGPGSIEGLGESFQPTLNTGTAKYQIGLVVPPGTAGQTPGLALRYDGGGSNGALGFGWEMEVPFVQRRSDNGIPRYVDGANNQDDDGDGQVDEADEIDVFIDGAREEFVPGVDGYYFRANEGAFIRYSRVADHWEGTQPDGTRLEFGITPGGRVSDEATGQVYRWLLERSTDPNGNTIVYSYKSFDDKENINQKYLSAIAYGPGGPPWDNFHFVAFVYEDRPDWFEDGRAGFLVRTGKRLAEIVIGTQAPDLAAHLAGDFNNDGQTDYLNRKYRLKYEGHPHWSLLTSVTWIGADGTTAYPPTVLSYTTSVIPDEISSTGRVLSSQNAPVRVMDNELIDLVDLNGDALPDILETQQFPGTHKAYLNLGERSLWSGAAITWKNGEYVLGDRRANSVNLENSSGAIAHLADMDADGLSDLVYEAANKVYYFQNTSKVSWAQRREMDTTSFAPPSPFGSENVKTADIDFNKHIDIIQSIRGGNGALYRIWFNLGGGQYSKRKLTVPDVGFMLSDPGVQIVDINGDRVPDIARVRPRTIDVTVGLGHGNFAPPVSMPLPDYTLTSQQVERARLHDINGDGLADLVIEQASPNQLWYWINLGNYSLDHRRRITGLPAAHGLNRAIRWADLNGNGTTDLVYADGSSASRIETVDIGQLLGSVPSPNLLLSIDNGLGRKTTIEYATSTRFLLEDRAQKRTWSHTLPFPVQVVSKVTVDDSLGHRYETDFSYHDGYYDGKEKEFRGFAEVIETEHGDETAPTTVTRHVYDVGDRIKSRKGLLVAQTIIGEGGDCVTPVSECYQQVSNTLATYTVTAGVTFSTITRTHTLVYENTDEPAQLLQTFAYDRYGNQTEAFNFGQVCPQPDGSLDVTCGSDERLKHIAYANNTDRWIITTPARIWQTDAVGALISDMRLYYDGEPYIGLSSGTVISGNLTRQEESLGPRGDNRFIPTERRAFDAYGNVIGTMDGNGYLTTIVYDDLTYTFPVQESIHVDHSRALTFTAAYDIGFGQVISATEYNSNTTLYSYDTFGRIASIVRPGDSLELPTQQFSYTLSSPLSLITTHLREQSGTTNVRASVVYFDGLGRKLQSRSEAERGQVIVADALTFNARQQERDQFLPYFASSFAYQPPDPALPHSSKEYDALARVVRTINPDGSFTSVDFQPLLQIQFDEEDNRPNSPHETTPKTLRYDGLTRLVGVVETNRISNTVAVTVTDPLSSTVVSYYTTYRYDPLGNLTTITDAQGNIKTMQYDALSRKFFMDDPDHGEMHYVYDDADNLRRTTDAKGQVITYTYDAANRPVTELWSAGDGTDETAFTYHYDDDLSPLHADARNTLGQVAYVEDPTGTVHFSYDARGNVLGRIRRFKDEGLAFVTRMEYDAMDRLVELTYPDGFTATYHYNDQGLHENIPDFIDNIDYTASGQRTAIAYANRTVTSYDYDLRLRLERLHSVNGQAALQDLTYVFDQVSNIGAIVDGRPNRTAANDQTQTFLYDSLYRLTQARGTYGQIDYSFDSIGNMVHQSSTITDTRLNLGEMRYDQQNAGPHALTFAGGETYRYDANGNRLGKGDTTYVWNGRDLLIATADEESSSTYAYDSDGQRIRQTVSEGGVITTTFYPGQYAEVRGDQFIRYIFDDQQRIAQTKTAFDPARLLRGFSDSITVDVTTTQTILSTTLWYIADHLGGTSLLTDADGQVVSEAAYYPYGLTRYEMNGGETHFQFTGKELDASGLYYYGARYYDALTGRFISVDPLYVEQPEMALENPQLLHLYAYAANNPVRYIDPNGLGIWDSAKGFVAENIDIIQTGLDVVGMIPVIGEAADLVNAGIYAARGDYASAALSVAAMVPFVGAAATGAKLASKAVGAIKKMDKLVDAGKSLTRLASKVCSFSSDTEVATSEGLQRIDQVQIGDLVLAYDENSGRTGYYTVTATFTHLDPLVIVLSVDGDQIETTPEHPFYAAAGEWIPAGELQIGDHIVKANGGSSMITAIVAIPQAQVMFNLTVIQAHTFYVGEGQWLVHNQCSSLLGGSHAQVRAAAKKGLGEVHHMPAASASPLSHGAGPAILMDAADHAKTASYGSGNEAVKYRVKQWILVAEGKYKKAFEKDVRDIQEKFSGKYDEHIQQAREYARQVGLFD